MQFRTYPDGLSQLSRNLALIVAAVAVITVSAKVQIPFWPVPMTLHTLAVMLISVVLGPRMGLAAMAGYMAAGLAGLPVFSGSPERGIGLAYVMGPTGGYLVGYLLAAWLTGWLAQGRGLVAAGGAMLLGLGVVYAVGVVWLAAYIPASEVIAKGIAPFVLGDLAKIGVALCLIAGWRRVGSAR